MKRIFLFFILVSIYFVGFSQDTTKYYISKDYGWTWKRGKFDSSLMLPKDTTRNKLGVASIGKRIYVYNSNKWNDAGSSFDTTSLSNRIDEKQDIIATGTSTEYIKGDGSLGTFPTIAGGTVTTLTKTNGTGTSITITNPSTTPNIKVDIDTMLISTKAWRQKGVDSLNNVLNSSYQPLLVSGTNIKTINSNSLLGSGNVAVGTVTSVTGTLPISVVTGTSTPTISVDTASITKTGVVTTGPQTFAGSKSFTGTISTVGITDIYSGRNITANGNIACAQLNAMLPFGVNIVGLYATSSTLGTIYTTAGAGLQFRTNNVEAMRIAATTNNLIIGTTTDVPSAKFQVSSTTQGILGARMTTTQKLAIASPAEGLEVYDLTLHQKSYYNGTSWINY